MKKRILAILMASILLGSNFDTVNAAQMPDTDSTYGIDATDSDDQTGIDLGSIPIDAEDISVNTGSDKEPAIEDESDGGDGEATSEIPAENEDLDDNEDSLSVDAIYPLTSDGSGSDEGTVLVPEISVDQPERTGLSYTDSGITINVTKSAKEVYEGTPYVSWSATISHTANLDGATITLTPGTDQKMYGNAGTDYQKYFDDISTCVHNADYWSMTVKNGYGKKSITVGWMTWPENAAYWDTHGFLTCSIDVSAAGGDSATYADVPGVYNKIPTLKIKTVDGNGTALKDCEMMISADRNLFAAAVTGLTMKYYQDSSATTPTATGTYARGTWKTGATGTITFTNALVLGAEYELKGIAAPAGYEALAGKDLGTFTVDAINYGDVLDVDLSNADTSIVSFDPITNTLLIKTDLNVAGSSILAQVVGTGAGIPDVSLSGAAFSIYKMEGTSPVPVNDTKIGTATSDASGLVKFKPAAANAWDPTADYYLVQTAAPNGFDIYKDAGATIYYTFTVDDEGIVQNRGTEWDNAEGGDAAQGKIVNLRKAGTLAVVRADIKTDTHVKTTDQIKYQIYEDAACTTEVADGEILLTKASGQGISEPAAALEWTSETSPKEYYIKETTDTSAMDAGYSVDEKIHGPYSFSTAMTAGKDALSGCAYTVDNANVKITATIIPQKKSTVRFSDPTKSLAGATFMITDDTIKVTTTDPTAADVEEVILDSDGVYDATDLMTGGTYTLTQTSAPAAGKAKIVVKFTVGADGKVTIKSGTDQATANNTATPPTVTLKETQPKMVFYMEVCTAEDGEYGDEIDKEKEVAAAPSGFAFSIYDSEDCSAIATNAETGKAISGLKTDSKGMVTISGLNDGDYYIKSTQTASVSNASQVQLDKDSDADYSIFKVTQSGGALTALTKVNSGGCWEAKNNKIRAKLKKGTVTIKAQSDKTFYLYRLYSGDSDSDDKREAKKMKGDTVTYTNADKAKYFANPANSSSMGSNAVAALSDMILQNAKDLRDLFILRAHAAESASKIAYAGQTWQLIASNQPGNEGSHTFAGLIAGQNYLIREGDEEDPEVQYYLAGITANKDLYIISSKEVIPPVRVRIFSESEDVTGKELELDAVDESFNTLLLSALSEGTKDGIFTSYGVPQQVKWTTSNPRIATVSNEGIVRAVTNGSATITATTTDGSNLKAVVKLSIKTAVRQIKITEAGHSLAKGKKMSLKVTVTPSGASNKNVIWRSDDESVLSVTANGTVTAVATGTAHIRACAVDGSGVESPAYEISVTKAAEQVLIQCGGNDVTNAAIGLDPDEDSRSYVNLTAECVAKDQNGAFDPADVGQEVTWKSANEKIASVSNGRVRALAAGTTQITATAKDGSGKSARVTINVARLIKEIEILGDHEVASGKGLTLSARVTPDSARNKSLAWSAVADYSHVSDDTFDLASLPRNAITISANGKISTNNKVPAGTIIRIRAAAKDGSGIESDWFEVTVTRPAEAVTITHEDVDVTGSVVAIDPDETRTIELAGLAVAKQNGMISNEEVAQGMIWKSANGNVATVDQNGRVTAVGNGTSVITATTTDGSNKTGKVTVSVGRLIKEIEISGEEYVGVGKSTVLNAKITPDSAANKNLIWTVDDPTVASVANGRVTIKPRGYGSIRVTAKAKDGSGVEDSCILTILTPVDKVTIEKDGEDVTRRTVTQDITDDPSISLDAICTAKDPAYEVSDSVTWKSSNTKVATVDGYGNVTLLSPGTSTITAVSADGSNKSASVTVKATRSDIRITSANEVAGRMEVAAGKTVKLIAEGPAVDWQILSTVPAVENPAKDLFISSAGMLAVKNTVAAGTEITVKAVDKRNAENIAQCTVTVRNPSAAVNLIHNDNGDRIVTGGIIGVDRDEPEPVRLSAEVTDAEGNIYGVSQLVTWKSGNTKVAEVSDDGLVTPVAAGTAKITATSADGLNKSASVTINIASLTGRIMISSAGYELAQGKSLQFAATASPARVGSRTLNWYADADYSGITDQSFDPASLPRNAVSISNNGRLNVNAKVPAGTSIRITAEARDGSIGDDGEPLRSNVCVVNVTKPTGRIDLFDSGDGFESRYLKTGSKLGLDRDSLGDCLYLKAFASGTSAFDASSSDGVCQSVIWSTSNAKVATVDQNGVVTSIGAGTAQIKATAADGTNKSASVTINVSSLVTELEINGRITIAGNKANTEKYTVNVKPDRAADKKVIWSADYDLPDGSDAVLKPSDVKISNGTLSISRYVPAGTRITIAATAADGGGAAAEKVVTVE